MMFLRNLQNRKAVVPGIHRHLKLPGIGKDSRILSDQTHRRKENNCNQASHNDSLVCPIWVEFPFRHKYSPYPPLLQIFRQQMFAIVQKRRLRVAGSLPKKKHRGNVPQKSARIISERNFPTSAGRGWEGGRNAQLPQEFDARGSRRAGRPPDLTRMGGDGTGAEFSNFCGARMGGGAKCTTSARI